MPRITPFMIPTKGSACPKSVSRVMILKIPPSPALPGLQPRPHPRPWLPDSPPRLFSAHLGEFSRQSEDARPPWRAASAPPPTFPPTTSPAPPLLPPPPPCPLGHPQPPLCVLYSSSPG